MKVTTYQLVKHANDECDDEKDWMITLCDSHAKRYTDEFIDHALTGEHEGICELCRSSSFSVQAPKQTSKWTPGPWRVGVGPGPIIYGDGKFGVQVANMMVPMVQDAEHKANVKLIAAAPELFETLKFALSILEDPYSERSRRLWNDAVNEARTVLEKAEMK